MTSEGMCGWWGGREGWEGERKVRRNLGGFSEGSEELEGGRGEGSKEVKGSGGSERSA